MKNVSVDGRYVGLGLREAFLKTKHLRNVGLRVSAGELARGVKPLPVEFPASKNVKNSKKRDARPIRCVSQREQEERLTTFFSTLALDLSDVHPEDEPTSEAVARLSARMRKRAPYVKPHLVQEAIDSFHKVNVNALFFDPSTLDSQILGEVRNFIYFVLNKHMRKIYETCSPDECFSRSFILDNWRFGPKASNGLKGKTGAAEKMDEPMTCTDRCEPYLRQIRMASPYFECFDAFDPGHGLRRIQGSKLTTVLKNEDAVRTIATEGSGNMAIQLAGGLFVEGALAGIGLNIRTQQPKNQELARQGSITGEISTMDLKSASDGQALAMIHCTWPQEWVKFFEDSRSPVAVIGGREVHLGMLSTMGNGFTFPVMTLTILAIIYAVRRINGGPKNWVDWQTTAVFGDDIIIPTHEFDKVAAALENFGYTVNRAKSFKEGPFRESCGGDYWKGVNITPFYVKSLDSPAAIYVAINQVLDWGSNFQLPLARTLRLLRSWLGDRCFIVPEWAQPDSGVRSAQCPRIYKYLGATPLTRLYKGKFLVPLAIGGYLSSVANGDDVLYSVCEDFVLYAVREAKLPSSYLDGRDPLWGSWRASAYRSLMVTVLQM